MDGSRQVMTPSLTLAPESAISAAERLFAGPGEMRARARAHDWAATGMGPVEYWPSEVHTIVRLVMAAGFPSALLWGPELTLIYNDAYIPLLGAQHPEALGRRVFDFAPETRETFEPLLARVRAGETISVADVPTTFRREALDAPPVTSHYTFSFAPVHERGDPEGPVAGIHVIVIETTAQVAQRKSNERLAAMFESLPVGVGIVNADGVFVTANREMGRYLPNGVIPSRDRARWQRWRVYDAAGNSVEPHDWPAARALRGEAVLSRVEMLYTHDDGKEMWVHVNAVPLKGDGGEITGAVMAITGIDALKQTEAALRESEARHAFLLELSDALGRLTGAEEIQTEACRLLCGHLGASRVNYAEIVGDEFVIRSSYADGVASITGRGPISTYSRALLEDYRRDGAVAVSDVATDPRLGETDRANYERVQTAATAGVMLTKGDRWVGSLAAHSVTPRSWTAEELTLLRDTANRIWAAAERARTEAALRETQQSLDAALATARMAYWQWDPATGRTFGSPSMDDIFGLPPGESLESSAQKFALVHPEDREQHRALVAEARARGDGWHAEFRIVRPRDGAVAWLEETARAAPDPHTGLLRTTGLVWDVTDRKRSEAAVERERAMHDRDELRRELAAAEEAERRRLARELHDQLGQHLTAVALELAEVRRLLALGRLGEDRLLRMEELVTAITRDARNVALELRPPELDDVGLESALHTYVAHWRERYGVSAELEVTGGTTDRSVSPLVGSALYRIVQEALTNVARHARAGHVSVLLDKRDDEVWLIVEDDGQGFDPEATAARVSAERRFGLAGMRERAALLGGTFEVESSEREGTTVYVRVPLREADA